MFLYGWVFFRNNSCSERKLDRSDTQGGSSEESKSTKARSEIQSSSGRLFSAMRVSARHDVFADGARQTLPVQPESCQGTRTVKCWRESFLDPSIIVVYLLSGSKVYALHNGTARGAHIEHPLSTLERNHLTFSPVSRDQTASDLDRLKSPPLLELVAAFRRHRSTSQLTEEIVRLTDEKANTRPQIQAGFPVSRYATYKTTPRKRSQVTTPLPMSKTPALSQYTLESKMHTSRLANCTQR